MALGKIKEAMRTRPFTSSLGTLPYSTLGLSFKI